MRAARKITARGYQITARANITAKYGGTLTELRQLDEAIRKNLKELGYDA